MNSKRRDFLKFSYKAALACGSMGIIASCTKEGTHSPFDKYYIDQSTCIGCGDCLPECRYDAINLPELSRYWIEVEDCIECGKCVESCADKAIFVSVISYSVNEEHCVGCGDCIDECVNEGNCISYERDYYFVRGRCRPNSCHLECAAVCEYDAITIGDKAIVNMDNCTMCGLCVAACPREAINPAKVALDSSLCNHCGKCFEACTFDAISRQVPEDYHEPYIDTELCTSCSDCLAYCPEEYSAISSDIKTASINHKKCTECGDCVESCQYDSIFRDH